MKKILAILLILTFVFSLAGCNEYHRNDMINDMLTYMHEKYTDDTFEFVSMDGGHIGSNERKIVVKSVKYPDKEIRVISQEVDGEYYLSDTYLNIKFERQTYEYIRNILIKEYGDNVYLKYTPDDYSCMKTGSSETLFEEYISDPTVYILFSAVVVESVESEEETLAKIKELFSNSVVRAEIFFVDTEELLSKERATEIIENNEYSKSLFVVKKTIDEYVIEEWSDGIK